MIPQPATMILVGVAQQKGIDIKSALRVARQTIAELFGNVGGIVIGIVRGAAYIDVDQDLATTLELDQRHIAVADHEDRNPCHHAITCSLPGRARRVLVADARLDVSLHRHGIEACQDACMDLSNEAES